MEYMTTEFIVMFTVGAIQWILALFIMLVFSILLGKVWRLLFPIETNKGIIMTEEQYLDDQDRLIKIIGRA